MLFEDEKVHGSFWVEEISTKVNIFVVQTSHIHFYIFERFVNPYPAGTEGDLPLPPVYRQDSPTRGCILLADQT